MGAFKLATTLEHVGDVTNYASGSKDAGTDDSLYEVFGACSGSTIPTSVFITK
jgi:hypothetical protein